MIIKKFETIMSENLEKELYFFGDSKVNKITIKNNSYLDCMLDFIPCILLSVMFIFSYSSYVSTIENPNQTKVESKIFKKNDDGTIDKVMSDGSIIKIYPKGKFFKRISPDNTYQKYPLMPI